MSVRAVKSLVEPDVSLELGIAWLLFVLNKIATEAATADTLKVWAQQGLDEYHRQHGGSE